MEAMMYAAAKVVKVNKTRCDDDVADRLNHQYTVIFLVVFTVIVTTTQYVGDPITCWCPAHFTDSHIEFANEVCWVKNTYYIPHGEVAKPGVTKHHIGYYQWVPVVLLVQAFLFYWPCLAWRVFSERSGININNMVEAADTIQNALYPERRDKTIKYMIRHLDHYLDYQREYRGGCCSPARRFMARNFYLVCGNRFGNYLLTLYLSIKMAYFINVIIQIFTLNAFLGSDFHMYGVRVLRDLFLNPPSFSSVGSLTDLPASAGRSPLTNAVGDGSMTYRFPRVTLCDFMIRQTNGVVHQHTVQCVLTINFFNEKIYAFLWFWYMFVAACTLASFFRWLWSVGWRYNRIHYVRRYLKIMGKVDRDNDRDRKLTHKFAQMYLRQDGVFVLKLVAKNSTDLVVADIVAALWDNYKNKPIFGDSRSDDLNHADAT